MIPEVRPGVRCPTGESRITPGFDLAARHVIHTVGPVWRGGMEGEPDLLAGCYRSALALAGEHRLRSIAFPAISCGVYGYPLDQAATLAVREIRSLEAAATSVEEIALVAFDVAVLAALRKTLG